MGGSRTLRPELEQALLDRVLTALKNAGWKTMHVSDSRMIVNRDGRFVLVADPECAGHPDILAIRPETGEIVVVECKRRGQKPRRNQTEWLAGYAMVGVPTFIVDQDNEAEVLDRLCGRVPIAA